MIAVTFALPAESSAFTRTLAATPLGAEEVVVVHTGVGARSCEKHLGEFLKYKTPRLLISSGFCGSTSDDLKPGDIVVAENYSTPALLKEVRARPSIHLGTLFSAEHVIDNVEDRYQIGRTQGAIAIDMETETIARLANAANILMLSLRVVSDAPACPFPAPPDVLFDLESQRTRPGVLLAYLARNPGAILRLAKFSKQIAFARTKLADALCALIPLL
ncbi:MAG: hypothetical protein ABI839_06060 [Verrucomicrobiota bacterium]